MSSGIKRSAEPADGEAKRAKTSQSGPKVPDTGLRETDVGITEYLYQGESPKITGILKQRYTDFQVNEIEPNGNVLHLTDLGIEVPEETKEEKKARKEQEEKKKAAAAEKERQQFHLDETDRKELVALVGEDDVQKMANLLGTRNQMRTAKPFMDRDERVKMHKLVRKAFDNRLETATGEDEKILIGVNAYRNNAQKPKGSRRDGNTGNLKHNLGPRKTFLRFSLYKENKETMGVANLLAKIVGVQVRAIKYAGTKDRRGVTVQRASLEGVPIERANSLNRTLRGFKIGGFEYSDRPVNLASLAGNEFIITLREARPVGDSTASLEETIKARAESLSTSGFVNYFGMQRFGTFSVSTHQVGKEVLNGNWKTAAELILSEQEIVVPASVEARKIWSTTKNPAKALKKMPRKCNAEFSILSRLKEQKKGEDGEYSESSYFNAIMGIPRNLRIMYGHAYQSYVWNAVASRRIQLFGLKVVPGDLVLTKGEIEDENGQEDVRQKTVSKAVPVTEEDIKANKYTIHDIVLPTPGFDVVYPENEQLEAAYVDLMAKDGLDPHSMSRHVREFSLPGSYRNVVSKVGNLQYWVRKYDNYTDDLVRTDLEILNMKKAARAKDEEEHEIDRILPGNPEGSKTAVILKLQLGPSTYATMALRELLVEDTSIHGSAPKKNI